MPTPSTLSVATSLGVSRPTAAGPDPRCAMSIALRAATSLAWREIIRFLRQRNRVIGAVGQPILFWLLFGTGMNQSFQPSGTRFSQYFIPGTLVMILLFTAIFATISIIEDRQAGFLQAVLVAPVPRWALVLGKVWGGTVLAVGQSLAFLLLTLTMGVGLTVGSALAIVAMLTIVGMSLTSLGFCIAWRLDSTQGFHAIMNLLLMPMWLLSGAFFPIPTLNATSSWGELGLRCVMQVNPVTYAVAGLRQLMLPVRLQEVNNAGGLWLPSLGLCWFVSVVFLCVIVTAATRMAMRPIGGDLQ